MQKSDTITNLGAALVQAQPLVKTALMESVNPFFKSKYADLGAVWEAVREALQTHDLAVTQLPDAINGEPALTTMLVHKSGDWIAATYPLVVANKDETAQGFGSAMTYARRYGLAALMGVVADTDDDGNAASKPSKPAAAKPEPTLEPKPDLTPETTTPKAWLELCLSRLPKMSREELDAFEAKHADRLARVRPMEPALHAKVVKALGDRQTALN